MVLVWALNYIAGKFALREFPSLLLACLRTEIAALAILPVYFLRRPADSGLLTKSQLPWVAFVGVFGLILNQVLFVVGLARTSVAHAALGVSLSPILVLLLAAAIGQERMTTRKILGMLIALGGVMVLQLAKDSKSTATLAGDALMLSFGCVFAFYSVTGKEIAKRFGSLSVNMVPYAGGALALAPVTVWQARGFDFSRVSASAWWSLIFMAVFAAVIASLIYYYALTYIPASRVSAVLYLQPLWATLLAIPTLGEHVGISLVIGGILILIGVYTAERA